VKSVRDSPPREYDALDENAHRGMMGKANSAAMQIALRRPILSEKVPKHRRVIETDFLTSD
jgi:hypothetical protein